MVLTAPIADEIRRLRDGRMRPAEIARTTGVSVRTVQAVIAGKAQGRPVPPAEQFADDARTGWAPLCMTADEWADWRAHVSFTGHHTEQAARPCDDCPLGFAADMRAEGRCNGTPGGVADEPEEEPIVIADPAPTPEPIPAAALPSVPTARSWPSGKSDQAKRDRARILRETIAEMDGDVGRACAALGVRRNAATMILKTSEGMDTDDPERVRELHARVNSFADARAVWIEAAEAPVAPPAEAPPVPPLWRAERLARELLDILVDEEIELARMARKLRREIAVAIVDRSVKA